MVAIWALMFMVEAEDMPYILFVSDISGVHTLIAYPSHVRELQSIADDYHSPLMGPD